MTRLTRRGFLRATASAPWLAAPGLGCSSKEARRETRGPLHFWLGGDVQLGDAKRSLFEAEIPGLRGFGVVNLEGPVAGTMTTVDPAAPKLHNAATSLDALRTAGVRVATIANNHARDAGPDAPRRTAEAIRSAALIPAGLDAGVAELTHDGWKIGVAAHDLTEAADIDAGALAQARSKVDVLVTAFHVTGPPSYLPAPRLREAVDRAIAAGADVVAAHGSHALGPVERRGRAVIAWGLGNLLFDCDCTREVDGLLLGVTVLPSLALEARAIPIDAGVGGRSARPSHDPGLILDLLGAIGSSPLGRSDGAASF